MAVYKQPTRVHCGWRKYWEWGGAVTTPPPPQEVTGSWIHSPGVSSGDHPPAQGPPSLAVGTL